jgi:hypothetical protein
MCVCGMRERLTRGVRGGWFHGACVCFSSECQPKLLDVCLCALVAPPTALVAGAASPWAVSIGEVDEV